MTTGWAGGEHVLDLTLDAAKNIVDDALHLAIRIDTDKIPAALLRAYTQIEIDAAAQLNPSGIATKGQQQEAKEAAKRGPRPKPPTAASGASTTSPSSGTAAPIRSTPAAPARRPGPAPVSVPRDVRPTLEPITAGSLADDLASRRHTDAGRKAGGPEARRLALVSRLGRARDRFRLVRRSPSAMDYLGNEFLVWIWHTLQNDGDTINSPTAQRSRSCSPRR